MASSTRRTGPGLRAIIAARAKETARQTIRTGWSTGMGASSETVDIAIWNALGTAAIPARPTLEPSLRGMMPLVRAENRRVVQAINRGEDPTPILDRLADRLGEALRREVLDLRDPPNAPSTIRQKGFDDPLVGAGSDGGRLVRELASKRIRR